MVTIKSYSDLQQSKKLAEILSIESADMFYADLFVDNNHKYIVHFLESYGFKTFKDTNERMSKRLNFIPCWSLASLLNVLPTLDGRNAVLCKDIRYDEWHICYHSTATLSVIDTERYNNPVDACYEMIIRLNELKML